MSMMSQLERAMSSVLAQGFHRGLHQRLLRRAVSGRARSGTSQRFHNQEPFCFGWLGDAHSGQGDERVKSCQSISSVLVFKSGLNEKARYMLEEPNEYEYRNTDVEKRAEVGNSVITTGGCGRDPSLSYRIRAARYDGKGGAAKQPRQYEKTDNANANKCRQHNIFTTQAIGLDGLPIRPWSGILCLFDDGIGCAAGFLKFVEAGGKVGERVRSCLARSLNSLFQLGQADSQRLEYLRPSGHKPKHHGQRWNRIVAIKKNADLYLSASPGCNCGYAKCHIGCPPELGPSLNIGTDRRKNGTRFKCLSDLNRYCVHRRHRAEYPFRPLGELCAFHGVVGRTRWEAVERGSNLLYGSGDVLPETRFILAPFDEFSWRFEYPDGVTINLGLRDGNKDVGHPIPQSAAYFINCAIIGHLLATAVGVKR